MKRLLFGALILAVLAGPACEREQGTPAAAENVPPATESIPPPAGQVARPAGPEVRITYVFRPFNLENNGMFKHEYGENSSQTEILRRFIETRSDPPADGEERVEASLIPLVHARNCSRALDMKVENAGLGVFLNFSRLSSYRNCRAACDRIRKDLYELAKQLGVEEPEVTDGVLFMAGSRLAAAQGQYVFLDVPENESGGNGPVGMIDGAPRRVDNIMPVLETTYEEFMDAVRKGNIYAEARHDGYVYYAIRTMRDVVFDNATAAIEVIERFKAREP
ncbi:MAG: hypothetical protein JW909_02170 [Planctomycetes bacterium]|nr:hypothetical protein [Planctomycetota bacterium]